ncbi:MAG: hypothetical protein JST26_11225 [Bacteroidetes bacterium]|nr:hypothetical protein [Bacteroidota bacterium]
MVTIENEDLRLIYHSVLTIKNILDRDLPRVSVEKSYLDNLVPQGLKGVYSQKQNSALTFVDSITSLHYDSSVVSLVTAFEKIVFAKYRTSYGAIKTVVNEKAEHPLDYYHSRERFVNTGIDKLAGIFYLIEGIIDQDTMEKLNIIKDHRNYIVHGKRDSTPPSVEFELDDIAKVLDKAISEISLRE